MVKINGKYLDCAGMTVEEYLKNNNYTKSRVAVEINGSIIQKSKYAETRFSDGDKAEIVSFVGGG